MCAENGLIHVRIESQDSEVSLETHLCNKPT